MDMTPERWERFERAARRTLYVCTDETPEWIVGTVREGELWEEVWVVNDVRRERYIGRLIRHMGGSWWNIFIGNLELTEAT